MNAEKVAVATTELPHKIPSPKAIHRQTDAADTSPTAARSAAAPSVIARTTGNTRRAARLANKPRRSGRRNMDEGDTGGLFKNGKTVLSRALTGRVKRHKTPTAST
jgi:hypothetical protein